MTIWKLVRTNVKNVRLGYMVVQPANNVFSVMCLVWTVLELPTPTAPNVRQLIIFTNLIHTPVKTVMLLVNSVMVQLPTTALNV